jgi:hypothetical protein
MRRTLGYGIPGPEPHRSQLPVCRPRKRAARKSRSLFNAYSLSLNAYGLLLLGGFCGFG